MSPTKDNQVVLFMAGKTGTGKSSTANSILGRDSFLNSDSSVSETSTVQAGWTRRCGKVIKVIDSPGTCDTRLEPEQAKEKIKESAMMCPGGFHALLLVLRYGVRFTDEDENTVANLKSVFGEDIVKDFCIVIFTYGDLYELNNKTKKKPQPFSDWCKDQKGFLKELIEECSNRVMLISNGVKENQESQLEELLSLVDEMQSDGVRVINPLFEENAKEKGRLITENNAPVYREKIQKKIDLLVDGLEQIKTASEFNDVVKGKLKLLKADAHDLEVEISVCGEGTEVLDNLRQTVNSIRNVIINTEIELAIKLSSERRCQQKIEQYQNNMEQLKRDKENDLSDLIENLTTEIDNLKDQKREEEELSPLFGTQLVAEKCQKSECGDAKKVNAVMPKK